MSGVINRFLNEFEQPTELTNETLKPSSKASKISIIALIAKKNN